MTSFEAIVEQKIRNNRGLYESMVDMMERTKKDISTKILQVSNQKDAREMLIRINNMVVDFEFIENLQKEYEGLKKECSIL